MLNRDTADMDDESAALPVAIETLEFEHATTPIEHRWVQRGEHLECRTCPNHHSSLNAVPAGHMLQKNNEGELEIVKIVPTPQPA